MRTASRIFYLAVFSLFAPSHTTAYIATRSKTGSADLCAIEPNAIVSDACASYETLDNLNTALTPSLDAITQTTDFFAYYRLNLFNRVCPFWNDANSMCGNRACAVDTLDNEEDIPKIWRAEELSKLEGPKAAHPGRQLQRERGSQRPLQGTLGEDVGESCVVEYDDECDERDYCVPEDESASAKGDYVSLVDNPERFTGYAGEGAHMVWDSIYKENCFSKPSAKPLLRNSFGGSLSDMFQAANDLRSVLRANSPAAEFPPEDDCLEKRVFYRVISGMHASISTHLCHDYLNQTTGEWGPNLQCYQERLETHPDRISNLYFNYALVLRALTKLRSHLQSYTFCSGDLAQDKDTKSKVLRLIDQAAAGPAIFDEKLMFQDPAVAGDLKDDFRQRFRNVSRLMDCVGCDKCRLWGKLQTVGYGTALKVLFEFEEGGEVPLKRTELVALVNTLARIGHSMRSMEHFRSMSESVSAPQISASVGIPTNHSTPKPASKSRDTDELDDLDDFGDTATPLPSVMDSIRDEFAVVLKAFRFVLGSWFGLPKTIFSIAVYELTSLWAYWLGLEVQPREWKIRFPSRDEL
ncbi:endoplasmic oxidoreductin-1 [Xylographa carneopallida]|nr:endoplasmic oxidoreductin-1 [Xylographa carneopallida]